MWLACATFQFGIADYTFCSIHFFCSAQFIPSSQFQPRLGPKPFTSSSSDISFDKVFSVPQVPGTDFVDTDQARDDKSLEINDLKDDDEGVEKDVDVQGKRQGTSYGSWRYIKLAL